MPPRRLKSFTRAFMVFRYFLASAPKRSAIMLASMIVAGLMEGIGILALLPLVSIVTDGGGSQTTLGRAVEDVVTGAGLQPSIGLMLLIVVTLIVAKSLLLLFASAQIGYTAARVTRNLRRDVLRLLMQARWSFFVRQRAGSLSAALTTEPGRAATCYMQTARGLTALLQIAVYLALSVAISWQVSIAALIVSLISALLLNRFVTLAGRYGREQTKLTRSLLSRLIDGLQAMKPIKAMGREEHLTPFIEADIGAIEHTSRRQVFAREALMNCREPIAVVTLGFGLYILLTQWQLDMESLLVMALLFLRIVTKATSLQTNLQSIAVSLPAFWFVRSVMSTATIAREPRSAGKPPALDKGLRLDRIRFAYGQKVVLHDITLEIPAGSFITVAGPSGGGKTTLIDVVVGLLRPQSGEVWIDDLEIRDVDLRQWRRMIGYVPQETVLFHDTVLSNVALRDGSVSEERVIEALKLADAWEFVDSMPLGVQTIVGERGSQLSGGQRQRLAIARALVNRPKLLILDEATTALDPETEAAICATVRRLTGPMTVIAISHQMAMQDAADRVYRLEGGRIVGTHDPETASPQLGVSP